MEILYVLIAISLTMASLGLLSFLWANASGQFLDLKGPAEKILYDDHERIQ
ncbi:MAG: cbb3-type cytochrome oxidase assembly protein CcoS [Proteobacteria bacterium]|nr:cbb3-type cytochrome oxidase assembly protein CcoS [Pseudomonadota bacterium]